MENNLRNEIFKDLSYWFPESFLGEETLGRDANIKVEAVTDIKCSISCTPETPRFS